MIKSLPIKKLVRNTFSVGIGRWIAQVLNVIFVPLALAFISPEDFGLFSILQIASLISGVLMSLGLSTAFMARYMDDREGSDNLLGRVLGQQVFLGGLLMIVLLLISGVATRFLANGQSPLLLQIMIVGEYFANLVLIINRWQILTDRHWQVSLVAVCSSVGQLLLLLVFVIWKRFGLMGLVLAYAGSNLIAFIVIFFLSRPSWKLAFEKKDIQIVYRYGLPAAPDTIFYWLLVFLPLYFLKRNGRLALAGAFSLGWRLVSPVDLLGNSLASAAAERIIDQDRNRDDLSRWYRLSINAIVFCILGILFFSRDILHIFFNASYLQVLPLFPLIAAAVMFLAFYYFEWISISGAGKTYGLSLASGAGVILTLIVFAMLNGAIGGLGIAILFAVSFSILWGIARAINSKHRLGHWYYLISSTLICMVLGWAVISLPSTWLNAIIKGSLLLALFVLIAGVELYLMGKENGWSRNEPGFFIQIPNYAEVAKKIGEASAILDIGCSEGFFLGDIRSPGLKVGMDIDLERLRVGREDRNTINFVCADADNLPFRNNCFGKIVAIGLLPYLRDPNPSINEMHRVLESQGGVELSTANDTWFFRVFNLYNWKHKYHFYSPQDLEEIVIAAGFKVGSIYTRGQLLAPLLGNLFPIPNLIDRIRGNSRSVLGPCARWTRRMTNPIIQWEYNRPRGNGYQIFLSGIRHE